MRKRIAVAVMLGGALSVAAILPAWAAVPKTFARMDGTQEVPGPGDPNGTGAAFFDILVGKGKICGEARYANIDPPTAMHIHVGGAGAFGGVVINLAPILAGTSRCVSADETLLRDIKNSPGKYYCNIHTDSFSAGAIRGQLERAQ